ncbi:MAG: SLC13 family permease, partial [Rhodospirillales bacterium]
ALLGVVIMIWMGTMTEVEAAQLVDWNVMAILVGIWLIAGYFGKTGVPSRLSVQALKLSGGRPGLLAMIVESGNANGSGGRSPDRVPLWQ